MFIHPHLARQRHRDLIAAAETARLAPAARTRRQARPRLPRSTRPAARPARCEAPARSA